METKIVNEVSFSEFRQKTSDTFRFLLSKWLVIGTVAVIGGLGGVLFAWIKKPVYLAEMSFVTDTESKSGFNAYAGLAAQFGIDLGGGTSTLFEGDNLIELLKSKRLVIETLLSPTAIQGDRRLLIDYYLQEVEGDDIYTGKNSFAEQGMGIDRKKDSVLLEVAEDIIKKRLQIEKRDKKLSIIDLKVRTRDEYFSKRFAEQLAQNAIAYYTEYKLRKSRQNVAILERQTDSVRRILYGNIGEVAAINDLNVNPIRQSTRAGSQRKQVEVQASGALYAELLKNLELSRLALRKETPLIQIVDTPILPLEKEGFGRLRTGLIAAVIAAALAAIFLMWSKGSRQSVFTTANKTL